MHPHRPGFTDYICAHPEEFADTPAVLIGDASCIADQLRRWQEELGISWWHLGSNLDSVARVVDQLTAPVTASQLAFGRSVPA